MVEEEELETTKNDKEYDTDIDSRCRPQVPKGVPTITRIPNLDGLNLKWGSCMRCQNSTMRLA